MRIIQNTVSYYQERSRRNKMQRRGRAQKVTLINEQVKFKIIYLSHCENPNYMMTLENTGSQCR